MKLSPKAQAALNQVISRLQAGDLSPVITIASIKRHPDDNMPSSNWTMSNLLLAYMTTGDLDARGYKQWQNVGRQVQKGERAGYILVPIVKKEKAGYSVWRSPFKQIRHRDRHPHIQRGRIERVFLLEKGSRHEVLWMGKSDLMNLALSSLIHFFNSKNSSPDVFIINSTS